MNTADIAKSYLDALLSLETDLLSVCNVLTDLAERLNDSTFSLIDYLKNI